MEFIFLFMPQAFISIHFMQWVCIVTENVPENKLDILAFKVVFGSNGKSFSMVSNFISESMLIMYL